MAPNGIFGLLQNVTVKGDYLEENVGGSASLLTLGLMCCILQRDTFCNGMV